MGQVNQNEVSEQSLNMRGWYQPWHSINTGGIVILTLVLLLICGVGFFTTNANYSVHNQQREDVQKKLEEVQTHYFLEEQYQFALNNKDNPKLSKHYAKFNQPTSFSEMKAYLKKWQTDLRIKTLNVTMEATRSHGRGQNIQLVPMRFTVHSLNDKMFYQLLEKLQNEAPGLIVIKHVDLKRVAGHYPETIEQLLAGKIDTLIEGTVVCDWFFQGAREQGTYEQGSSEKAAHGKGADDKGKHEQ